MTASRRVWVVIGASAGAVIAAVVLVFLLVAGGSDDEPSSSVSAADTGFVFVGDGYVDPPYEVAVVDLELRLNGRVVRTLSAERVKGEPFDPPAEPADAVDALMVAVTRFDELGGASPDPPDAAVVDELTSLLLSLPPVVDVERSGAELIITDESGEQASLLLMRPDPAPASLLRASLEADAAAWQEVLEGGGAIFHVDGATLIVPGPVAPEFLSTAWDAVESAAPDRADTLTELMDEGIASALLDAGPPPPAFRDRLPNAPDASTLRLDGARPMGGAAFVADVQRTDAGTALVFIEGEHGQNQTPQKNRVYIFTPVTVEGAHMCYTAPVVRAANRHNYVVTHYDGNASTVDRFASTSGSAGVLFQCMHGGNAFEHPPDKATAKARVKALKDAGLDGARTGSWESGLWGVIVTHRFLTSHWQSAGTIVFNDGCSGMNHHGAYSAREYIGTFELCSANSEFRAFQDGFWGRLDGTVGNGRVRPVGAAFERTFAGSIWQLKGSGGGKTVLVPAVSDFQPEVAVPVSPTVPLRGFVRFDAAMDRTMSTGLILELSDVCDGTLVSQTWRDEYTYEFEFTTQRPGPLKFTVIAAVAGSEDEHQLKLDGNENPEDGDHIGPSGDNWITFVECTDTIDPPTSTPTATPTTIVDPTESPTEIAVQPPTATIQPTATASATEEPSATATQPPTATPTEAPTQSPTPAGVSAYIDGYTVIYTGPLAVTSGQPFTATFFVYDSDGNPAAGEFFATLGDPPGDAHATHGSTQVGPDGSVTITLDVNWPAGGETKLFFFFPDAVHEIARILVR